MSVEPRVISLAHTPIRELSQHHNEIEQLTLMDTMNARLGKMHKKPDASINKQARDKQRRYLSAMVLKLLDDKTILTDMTRNWDEIQTAPERQIERQLVNEVFRSEGKTRDEFFQTLRYRLHGGIRVKTKSGKNRRLKPHEIHRSMQQFDDVVDGISQSIGEQIVVESRHDAVAVAKPIDIQIGKSWWYEIEVPVPDKTHKLSDAEIPVELEKLNGLRDKFKAEMAGLKTGYSARLEELTEKLRTGAGSAMRGQEKGKVRAHAESLLTHRMDGLGKLLDNDPEMGLLVLAEGYVKKGYNVMWALEAARDKAGENLEKLYQRDTRKTQFSGLKSQQPDTSGDDTLNMLLNPGNKTAKEPPNPVLDALLNPGGKHAEPANPVLDALLNPGGAPADDNINRGVSTDAQEYSKAGKNEFFEAGNIAMLEYSGVDPKELAKRALKNMPEKTVIFTPDALDIATLEVFAESKKIAAIISADPLNIGRHRGEITKERGTLSAYQPDLMNTGCPSGYHVIVDSFREEGALVIINPRMSTLKEYEKQRADLEYFRTMNKTEAVYNALTKDFSDSTDSQMDSANEGALVQLAANVSLADECRHAVEYGAKGAGLIRSERLLLSFTGGQDEQALEKYLYQHYSMAAQVFDEHPMEHKRGYGVNVRAFDLGGDKIGGWLKDLFDTGEEDSLRGLGVLRKHEWLLRAQLKAVMRVATEHKDMEFTVPMVENADDVKFIRRVMDDAVAELAERKDKYNPELLLGVMVETPEGIANMGEILATGIKKVSIGHNDLTCAVLGINQAKFKSGEKDFDPRVLNLVQQAFRNMNPQTDPRDDFHYPLTDCGDIAGDPVGALLLVGMGYRKLSMAPDEIPAVRRAIRACPLKGIQDITEECLILRVKDDGQPDKPMPLADGKAVRDHFMARMLEEYGVNLRSRIYSM